MGILEESKKAKGNGIFSFWKNKKIMIPLAAVIIIILPLYYFLNNEEEQKQNTAPKEWTVKKANIIISTEADGKVVAEDGVDLSFSVNDDNLEVKEVFVKEGDTVKKGDQIATVETTDLELSLSSAWSSYQSAMATYNETIDGAADDQIADAKDKITTAEISLEQARQSLEESRQDIEEAIYDAEKAVEAAEENLDDNRDELSSEDVNDAYDALLDTLKSTNISLDAILKDSDEIIGVDKKYLNDEFEAYLGVLDVGSLTVAKGSYAISRDGADELNTQVVGLNRYSDYADIDAAATMAVLVLINFEKHLNDMKSMLDATITSTDLTESELNVFIASISANRTVINTKITALNTKVDAVNDAKESLGDYIDDYEEALRDLENAKANVERDLYNAEASVTSKEISFSQAKRDYEDLIAPLTNAETAAARARWNSSLISYQKARNNLDEATIISPIDGQIVELNYKVGDIIVDNDDPVAVILNSETLFIEVKIEEADVSDLKVGQKASAVFDALDELKLNGEISFISLTSVTNNNGIVTYKVRVVIENPNEEQIREGMTAYIDFISGGVENVLVAPVSAVRNVDGKPSLQLVSGEWVPVVTGFTDGKNVEIISGINAGDKILY